MGEALVDTVCDELILAHVEAVLYALGESHSQGKVTASILVVERVVEEDVALTNGGVLSNEGAFAQAAGILVLLSIVLTLIGGLIPSRKAAKSDPVAALRSE